MPDSRETLPETGVVPLDPKDPERVEAFAELHALTLPESVPAELGPRFMRGFYFSKLVESGLLHGDLFRLDGRYVAHNLYTTHPGAFLREGVRRHFFFLLGFMPIVFLTRPSALRAIPHLFENQSTLPSEPGVGYGLTFGIHADHRRATFEGRPIGALLIENMYDFYRKQGFKAVEATVDRDNRVAIIFYRTVGFRFEDRGIDGGRKLQMRYDLA